jgi:Sulfotransferase family
VTSPAEDRLARWRRRAAAAASDPAGAWRTLRRRHLHGWYLDAGGGPEDTVMVAGSARSGTTWVADLVNAGNDHRYVFEPFRPDRLAVARPFGTRRYLPPEDDDPVRLAAAADILAGRVRGRWPDQLNRAVLPRRRLVKDVWANLILGWLHRRFPEVPLVLVLRHPCAVVSSQLALAGWGWGIEPPGLPGLLGQQSLVRDHLERYRDILAAASSPFQRHLVTWCVENLVPLRQLGPGQAHVVLYERLCAEPAEEVRRLLAFLGRTDDDRVLARLGRPSVGSREHSAIVSGARLVDAWVPRVERADLEWAVEVLRRFGLDEVYGADPMPAVRDGDQALAAVRERA